ncbi:hypothetical protein AUC43_01885 [Hymenobacter sedentarius]|uniref:STAS/SEC14 domain-containing protein n=1 Tax=Hymenobacter sedentarius TaxID=1411621 RepID=A0A0U3SCU5_9BACT|nr:hypothetical protein [Hymenobacter sedentarius]ALW83958.1 hypothetical protein AUC43_01885 [Hymenobacter sedentarius]
MPQLSHLPEAPLPSLTFCPVTCRTGSSLLRGRLKRALSAEEVTKTCEVLLATATRRRCRYWLLDGRESSNAQPPQLHEWLEEDYFPRVRAQLGHPPCIALLVAPSLWQDLPKLGQEPVSEWPTWAARVGWFKEEEPALAWLQKHGAHERERQRLLAASTGTASTWRGEQLRFNF